MSIRCHRPALLSCLLLGAGCDKHQRQCRLLGRQSGTHDGFAVPGEAGAPQWGMPATEPETQRVRRSWTSLTLDEQQEILDGFIALKQITIDSGDPGSARAGYDSICSDLELPQYTRNLYDYYVEAHTNAFLSMDTPEQGMMQMSHMGPQFLPWHRYLLLRIEADMAEVLGDPDFAMPYWDWQDCYDGSGGVGLCPAIFDEDAMGSAGTCDGDEPSSSKAVEGFLTDRGFRVNLQTDWSKIPFKTRSIVCESRKLMREVGCSELADRPPSESEVDAMFDRVVYDDAPYDSCDTEEDISFRQYLEGYDNDDTDITCNAAGCVMHSAGHIYIGGDMFHSSASPNDPMFFLHHANVDRMWAAWQEANIAAGWEEDYGNPGYPDDYRGALFVWDSVDAAELFDYPALGYTYDSFPSPAGDVSR